MVLNNVVPELKVSEGYRTMLYISKELVSERYRTLLYQLKLIVSEGYRTT